MRRLLLWALLGLCLAGFTWKDWHLLPGQDNNPYGEAYSCWTRQDSVHRDLDLVLEAKATMRSPQFQEAYLRRWAEVYKVSEGEMARLLAAEKEQEGRALRFLLVAQTGKREWNDFDKPDSLWRIYLQNERGQRIPLSAKRHLENRTEAEGFFRLEPWSEAYELSFDLEGEEARGFSAQRLTLILASVLGEAEFSWDVGVAGR